MMFASCRCGKQFFRPVLHVDHRTRRNVLHVVKYLAGTLWRELSGERFGGNFAILLINKHHHLSSNLELESKNSFDDSTIIPSSAESFSNNGAVLLSLQALPSFFERRIRHNCKRNHQRAIGRRRFRTSSSLDRCRHVSAVDNDFGRSQ